MRYKPMRMMFNTHQQACRAQPRLIYREHHMRPASCVESAMTCCSATTTYLFSLQFAIT